MKRDEVHVYHVVHDSIIITMLNGFIVMITGLNPDDKRGLPVHLLKKSFLDPIAEKVSEELLG